MKDEIKEILDDLDYAKQRGRGTITLSQKDINLLLDYITNLQENARGQVNDYFKDKYADEVLKNVKLQEENEILEKEQLITNMAYETVLNFYKSRNKKAIEYIHNHQPVFELSNKKQIQEWFEKLYYIELLNILNGDLK